ncbi:DUF4167 domain-containing protein [Alphaproteobacteria bacterium]|nr:DUF4167 domain-containing protein [Alphaproteobacteria bacterium]
MRKFNNRHQGRGKSTNHNNTHNHNNHNNAHKARNHAKQQLERYLSQARDAQTSGDRVLAEKFFQFADHHYRVLASLTPDKPPQQEPSKEKRDDRNTKSDRPQTEGATLDDQPVDVDLSETQDAVKADAAPKESKPRRTASRPRRPAVEKKTPDEAPSEKPKRARKPKPPEAEKKEVAEKASADA